MNAILNEIKEIPGRAEAALSAAVVPLPLQVPYLGMGSSYFAPSAFRFMGVDIYPEIASEYFYYLRPPQLQPLAVILSQSGKSTEALWCADLFEKYYAVTNYPDHDLGQKANALSVIDISAGPEQYSSSKTYVNTLIALFRGFNLDPKPAVALLDRKFKTFEFLGKGLAESVYQLLQKEKIHGIYIIGNGPNIATALEAALILSETTKLAFIGMSMAQYDHGPKETARDSIVIQINSAGKTYERARKLASTIKNAGAFTFEIEEPELEEHFSVLTNIIPFNFMAFYLAQLLNVGETFIVGGKITEIL